MAYHKRLYIEGEAAWKNRASGGSIMHTTHPSQYINKRLYQGMYICHAVRFIEKYRFFPMLDFWIKNGGNKEKHPWYMWKREPGKRGGKFAPRTWFLSMDYKKMHGPKCGGFVHPTCVESSVKMLSACCCFCKRPVKGFLWQRYQVCVSLYYSGTSCCDLYFFFRMTGHTQWFWESVSITNVKSRVIMVHMNQSGSAYYPGSSPPTFPSKSMGFFIVLIHSFSLSLSFS